MLSHALVVGMVLLHHHLLLLETLQLITMGLWMLKSAISLHFLVIWSAIDHNMIHKHLIGW
jgi:hypothetical protein